jgi:5-hydroxyisourate hydrolase
MSIALEESVTGGWRALGAGATDDDGRLRSWGATAIGPGTYRLVFGTGEWFTAQSRECFYPEVTIAFIVDDEAHYHVPLLLAPYAYSTYRGS